MSTSYVIRPAPTDLRSPNIVSVPLVEKELFETSPQLLTELLASNAISDPRGCGVLQNYLTDVKLADTIQRDLFQAAVPYIWAAWQSTLLSTACLDTTSELHSTLFAKPRLHIELGGPELQERVETFVRQSLLHAAMTVPGIVAGLKWVPFWVSVGSSWPWLAGTIWDDFLGSSARAHAEALLYWMSCLAYPTAENPFSIAPRDAALWAQASFDSTLHWKPEALAALDLRLRWSTVEDTLKRIDAIVSRTPGNDFVALVVADIRSKRQTSFLRRKSIVFKNLGTPGTDKFWDDEFGVGTSP